MNKQKQYEKLIQWLKELGNAAIAFSGGVDSTFVLAAAHHALDDKVIAFTVKTPYIPDWELEEAVEFCKHKAIRHQIIKTGILNSIRNNPENRCYLCKKHLFTMLKKEAANHDFDHVLDGTNADDQGVHRPGLAALKESGIRSPLLENDIPKKVVRQLSADMGLPTADKPSYACLLTRLPYNYEVRPEELERIEKAEVYLASLGFKTARVRNHGNIARIEVEKERISEFIQIADQKHVAALFREWGYDFITVDVEGYQSGSFDKKIIHYE